MSDDKPVSVAVVAPEPPKKKAKPATIKIMSKRKGEIVFDDGTLRHEEILEVSEARAEWLEKTFPGQMKRI